MDHSEGASSQLSYRVDFDARVRLEFQGAQITSDGGLLVMRELDDALALSDLAATALRDTRRSEKTIHRLDRLFRLMQPHHNRNKNLGRRPATTLDSPSLGWRCRRSCGWM